MIDQPYLDDFRNFLWLCWKHLGLPNPAPIQYDIAEYLQNGPERSQIQAMRGAGKSWMTAAFAMWNVAKNPKKRILVISDASIRAIEFVQLCRTIIRVVPGLSYLTPQVHQRDSAHRFDVGPAPPAKDPSIAAYGITSTTVGTHVDMIIFDDVETEDNALTKERRDRLISRCLGFEFIINPGGRIIFLGTPHTLSSIYYSLPEDYRIRRWPSEYPDLSSKVACHNVSPRLLELAEKFPQRRGKDEPGSSTYPERYKDEYLRVKQARTGWTEYAMQMLLDVEISEEERYPLKLSDFIVMDVDPIRAPSVVAWGRQEPYRGLDAPGLGNDCLYKPAFIDDDWREYTQKVLYIDPAGRGDDEVGFAVGLFLNGVVFIPVVGGLKGGYNDSNLEYLAKLAGQYGIKRVVLESNYGDGMFTQLLRPVMSKFAGLVAIEERRVSGQKQLRIIKDLEAPLNQHRIVISPEVGKDKTTMQQVTHLSKERRCLVHDDRVEALSGAVWAFGDSIGVDPEVVATKKRIEEKNKMVKSFIKDFDKCGGRLVDVNEKSSYVIPHKKKCKRHRRSLW